MFREGIRRAATDRPDADIEELVQAATKLSERLIVLMRRKMLLPTLQELIDE